MKRYILTLIICTILSLTSVKATTKVVFNETSNGNINTTLGFDTGFVGGIDITLKIKGNVSYENFNLNNISNAKYSNITYDKNTKTINIILLTGGVGTSHNLLDKNKNLNLGTLIVNANTKNDISYSLECSSLTILDNSWKSSSITPELVDSSLTYKGEKEETPGSDNKPSDNENNNDSDKDNSTENNNGNSSENKDNDSSSNNNSSSQNNGGTNSNQNSSSNGNSSASSNSRPSSNASGNTGSTNSSSNNNSSSKNDKDDEDTGDEDQDDDEDDKKEDENTNKTDDNKTNNTTITNGNTTSEEEEENSPSILKIVIPAVGIVALGTLSYCLLKRKKKTPNDFDI